MARKLCAANRCTRFIPTSRSYIFMRGFGGGKVAPKLNASDFSESLFLRDDGLRGRNLGLPHDVLSQSARRLRILALLYAFVFFMAGYFPDLLFSDVRAHIFSSFALWGPGMISIAVALFVAALTSNPRIPLSVVMVIGLGWQLRHRSGRILGSDRARFQCSMGGSILGRSVDSAVHRCGAEFSSSDRHRDFGLGQFGSDRDRLRDREQHRAGCDSRQILPWAHIPLPTRCRDGLRGGSPDLRARQGTDAGPCVWGLPLGRAARRRRDGRGMAGRASLAGAPSCDQAGTAGVCRHL